jgi:hypothetical protein
MPMTTTENEEQVKAYFDSIENQMETSQPGILDILKVYGDCSAAIEQADLYLSATSPSPSFFTTNGSNF